MDSGEWKGKESFGYFSRLEKDLREFVWLVEKRSYYASQDSKKIGGMRNIRDVPFKPLANEFGDRHMVREEVRARSSSLVERQRDADIPLRSLGYFH
ncbi:unnamed protein product [Prunus brigantina]